MDLNKTFKVRIDTLDILEVKPSSRFFLLIPNSSSSYFSNLCHRLSAPFDVTANRFQVPDGELANFGYESSSAIGAATFREVTEQLPLLVCPDKSNTENAVRLNIVRGDGASRS